MLKPSHAAGTKDLTINPSVSPRSTSDNSVARRLRPVNRLSMPRTAIPAKKHHVAREGFFGSRLAKARSRAKIAAANGRKEKSVTCPQPGGFNRRSWRRNHHNNRNRGIRDSAKKKGPPRW